MGTLALGIGAATTIQSVVDPLLLRPLAFHEPDRPVTLSAGLLRGEAGIIREQSRTLSAVSLYMPGQAFGVAGDGEAERITGARITPELFTTLGAQPFLGTSLEAASADGAKVAAISHALWNRGSVALPTSLAPLSR